MNEIKRVGIIILARTLYAMSEYHFDRWRYHGGKLDKFQTYRTWIGVKHVRLARYYITKLSNLANKV